MQIIFSLIFMNRNYRKYFFFKYLSAKRLPYTEAFILEAHRLAILATNWGPHTLTGDVRYRGFTLKKVENCQIIKEKSNSN